MAKVLNIDSLGKSDRVLELGGKSYPVDDMTVENFIETNAEAKRIENDKDESKQVIAARELIKRSIPTIEIEVLNKLRLEQLFVIVRFVSGAMDDEPVVKKTGEEAPAVAATTDAEVGDEKKAS